MITLYFVRMWLRWLFGSVGGIVLERVLLDTGWFILAALVTVVVLVGVTWLMVGDWRSARRSGSGYRYDIIRDVTHR